MKERGQKQRFQSIIFTGMLLAFFLILSCAIFLGRKNWDKGLRLAVEQVLPASEWQCGNAIPINSNFSISSALYEIVNIKSPSKKSYALVLRISTYFGPLPAVFLYQDGKATFEGIAYLNNSIAKEFKENKFNRQIDYWTNTAALVVRKALESQEASK